MGLLFLILGLVWWFPIGLFILAAFLVSRAIGHWHRPQFAGAGGPPSGWGDAGRGQWESRMADRAPSRRGCGPGNWRNQPSSENRAFDDYRADTLRRLEDEQREFKDPSTAARREGSRRIRSVLERAPQQTTPGEPTIVGGARINRGC